MAKARDGGVKKANGRKEWEQGQKGNNDAGGSARRECRRAGGMQRGRVNRAGELK